jgi:hypothetical protein
MTSELFITCVDPDRPHPSGRLAFKLQQQGLDTFTLFENARSLLGLGKDAKKLLEILKLKKYEIASINVNGSIAQALAVGICRWHGIKTKLWIMDSYPGCLRYVTRWWILFYPFFFLAAFFAKLLAQQILIIDEAFLDHAPSWHGYRRKCVYTPLPQEQLDISKDIGNKCVPASNVVQTIGLLGNIELAWLNFEFENFYKLAIDNGCHILIATSNLLDPGRFARQGFTCVIPWPESKTEEVFKICSAILVPLTEARLIYSSPSKIIDCYMRGIQPVVMVNLETWNGNKNRIIYEKCMHISDYFSNKKRYSSEELIAFSQHWIES